MDTLTSEIYKVAGLIYAHRGGGIYGITSIDSAIRDAIELRAKVQIEIDKAKKVIDQEKREIKI